MALRIRASSTPHPSPVYNPSVLNRTQTQLATRPQQPRFKQISLRHYATSIPKVVCQCGAELPEAGSVVKLFLNRNLRTLEQEVKCAQLKSYKFISPENCQFADTLQQIASSVLRRFPDVIHMGHHLVFLEALRVIPDRDLGDLTGDHGKQLAKFLQDCRDKGSFSQPIGSIVDVGGQNISTVTLASKVINPDEEVPALIIDLNSLTPAISAQKENVKYAVDDALSFFTSSDSHSTLSKILTEKPNLMIFNNLLNVLKAEDGWKTLEAAWNHLRTGDYLIITGLVPEHLERTGLKRKHEIDGIVEFHSSKGFYKSALATDFPGYIESRLDSASILLEEVFKFMIETRPPMTMDVTGRRLLTLRKV